MNGLTGVELAACLRADRDDVAAIVNENRCDPYPVGFFKLGTSVAHFCPKCKLLLQHNARPGESWTVRHCGAVDVLKAKRTRKLPEFAARVLQAPMVSQGADGLFDFGRELLDGLF